MKLKKYISLFILFVGIFSNLYAIPSTWIIDETTGNTANIGFELSATYTINGRAMANGDAIGLFFNRSGELVCGGYLIWNGTTFGMTIWGDNDQTQIKDGFAVDENFIYKLWDNELQTEVENPVVNFSLGNQYYVVDGINLCNGFFGGSASSIVGTPFLSTPNDSEAGISITPTLSWLPISNAISYQLQVSTNSDFTDIIEDDIVTETNKSLSLNYSSTYYWRVKAIAGNNESAWSMVWNFATQQEPIAAPLLSIPFNNYGNIAIPSNLEWYSVPNVTDYQVQVSTNSDFINIIVDDIVSETNKQLSLNYFTTYYWRVKAIDGENESVWSEVWSFTTQVIPIQTPTLNFPLNDVANLGRTVFLEWNAVANATSFQVQVSTIENFTDIVVNEIVSETNKALSLNYSSTYYWRIKAIGENSESAWSETRHFTTQQPQTQIPYLSYPSNDAVNIPNAITLNWYSVPEVIYYQVQMAITPEFTAIVLTDMVVESEKSLTNLNYYTQYYWRVRAIGENSESDWSEVWHFTTQQTPLTKPILNIPLNEAVNIAIAPELNWYVVANASSYRVQVSNNSMFTNLITDEEVVDNRKQINNVAYSSIYYWRVKSINQYEESPWSDIWSFTTVPQNVVVPTLQAANIVFSNVTQNSMKVRWSRGNGDKVLVVAYPGLGVNGLPTNGANYTIGSAVGGGFVVYNGTARTCDVTGLASGTNYTFKAYEYFSNDFNYQRANSYLNPRTKATLIGTPSDLVLDELNSDNATVTWSFEGEYDYFEVDLAYDAQFSNLVPEYTKADFAEVSANFIGLSSNTEYFVRVRTTLGMAHSSWSNTLVFRTTVPEPNIPATNAFVSNPTANSLAVNWTKGNGDYSIVLASESNITAYPEDGESYSANNNYPFSPSLYGVKIVYSGTASNFVLSGLQANTEYHLAVYTFNGDNNNENYNLTPAKAVGKTIDLAPTIAPTNFEVTNRTSNNITANWNAGNSSKFIVLALANGTEFTQAPVEGISYSVGETLGNANIVAIGSANSISQFGLIPNTEYRYAVYGFNGANGSENYLDQALIGTGRTLALTPEAPTALAINSKSSNFMNLSWNGNASKYLVLASTSPITTTPTNGYSYSGDVTIDGAKVVYSGANISDSVSNLIAQTHYYFRVFAYNGSNGSEVYSSHYASTDGYTLANLPNTPIDIAFSNVTRNSMKLTWTNSVNSIVLMNTTGIFNFAPQAGQTYSEGSNDIYYIGSNNLLTLNNLNEETTYYFRIYSFNGTNNTTNYSTNYVNANQRTRSGVKQLVFTAPTPTMLTSGNLFSVRVAMMDDLGVPVTSLPARTQVQLAKTSTAGTLYGILTTSVDANGYATFNNLGYVGTEQLILTATMLGLSKSDTITVEMPAPTQQERAILFTNVTTNSMTVKWSKGNGSDRILVMKKGSAPIGTPWGIYQEGYPFGTSLIVGNSGYDGVVVFKGTTTQANITDLQPGITYFFRAYGYNNPASPRYCTATGSFNPRSRTTTLNKDDVAPNDELTEANINNNNFFIGTVNPNPVVNHISFKMTNLEDMTMSIAVFDAAGREVMKFADERFLNKGTHDFNFDINDVLSSGTYLLVVTSGEQTAVQPFSIVK